MTQWKWKKPALFWTIKSYRTLLRHTKSERSPVQLWMITVICSFLHIYGALWLVSTHCCSQFSFWWLFFRGKALNLTSPVGKKTDRRCFTMTSPFVQTAKKNEIKTEIEMLKSPDAVWPYAYIFIWKGFQGLNSHIKSGWLRLTDIKQDVKVHKCSLRRHTHIHKMTKDRRRLKAFPCQRSHL